MLSLPAKYGREVLDYALDWAARLDAGEEIASGSVAVLAGDVVVGTVAVEGSLLKFWLSGGTTAVPVQRLRFEIVTDASPPRTMDVVLPLTLLG